MRGGSALIEGGALHTGYAARTDLLLIISPNR